MLRFQLGLGLEQRTKGKGSSRVFLLFLISALSVGGSQELALGNSPSQLQTQGSSNLAQSGTPAKSGGIEPSTLEGRLDSNSQIQKDDKSYYNVHTFEGRAGEQITIELTSSEFDSYLILLDSESNKIAEDDDGGSGNNARIIVTLPTSGTYTIITNAYKPGETGHYRLSWRETTSNDLALVEADKLMQQVTQLRKQGKYAAAIPLAERALAIQREVLGQEHPLVADSLNSLALLYASQGRYNQAEFLYRQSLEMRQRLLGNEHRDVAQSLHNLAHLYESQGRYNQAESLYGQALDIHRRLLGDEHPVVALNLNNLALVYESQGRYNQAESLYRQALDIHQRLLGLGNEHPLVADSLNNLANLYLRQGRYSAAEPLYRQALEMRQRLLGNEHPNVALSLNNLAGLYSHQGRYNQAESLYRQALEMRQRLLGNEHPDVASSLNNLADLYKSQGRYNQAESLYCQALEMRQRLLGNEHPDVASSLNNLAGLYESQGRYNQAESLYRQALEMRQRLLENEHPDVASSLNNLAFLYERQGRYSAAEPLYRQALEMKQRLLENEHPDVATMLNNLADLYQSQGRYSQAEPLHRQSLEMRQRLLGNEHPVVADSLNNLAHLYSSQGRYSQAEPLYRQALKMSQRLLGKDHPDVAESLNNLAHLYSHQGRYSEAERLYHQALEMKQRLLGQAHPSVALSLNNLAALYQSQARYDQAEPLYRQALEMRQNLLGQEHPDVATTLNNLAALYKSQGRYSQAETLHHQALEMRQNLLGNEHPNIAQSLNNLAALYQAQGNPARAVEFLSQGMDVEERNLDILLAVGSERQKQDYMATLTGTTNATISLHTQSAPSNPQAAHLAFTTIVRRKGRILDAFTDNLLSLRQNLTPENQVLLDQLVTAYSQLASLQYKGAGNIPLDQYRQQLADLEAEVNKLENTLSYRSEKFRSASQSVTLEGIQQLIPAQAALVELVLYEPFNPKATKPDEQWGIPRYAAHVLHRSGDLRWVDLGEASPINQAVTDFRSALQSPSSDIQPVARALDEKLMQPIRKLLGDTRTILLSPDSQLNLIPFAALVDENNNYLIKNYSISYLTSGRDLLRLQTDAPSRQAPVLLANPDYANPGNPQTVQIASTRASTAGATTGGSDARRSVDFAQLRFTPLEGTKLEADTIAPLLPNVTVLAQSQATENALKQLQAPSILHIATHGFFLQDVECTPVSDARGGFSTPATIVPEYVGKGKQVCRPTPRNTENPLLRSGLALAGFNPRSSGTEDGVLTALEATGLNLYGTRLVVLSACETGLGDVNNGEGVYGLRRAFVTAGAESQLMSLWKVDDYGTSELMSLYYKRLQKGEGRSEALRQVQLEMMQAPTYQHPYYWASFIFSGNWSSIGGL